MSGRLLRCPCTVSSTQWLLRGRPREEPTQPYFLQSLPSVKSHNVIRMSDLHTRYMNECKNIRKRECVLQLVLSERDNETHTGGIEQVRND